MKIVPIETVDDIDRDTFVARHLQGIGKPLVVRNFARNWPAGSKWSFAYFKDNYANDFALIPSSFDSYIAGKLTKLGEFIDRIDDSIFEIPGFWLDKDLQPLKEEPAVDESLAWNLFWDGFKIHPEMISDVSPAPHFIPDLQSMIDPPTIKLLEKISLTKIRAIYMGRKGTITPLHTDFYDTHGCLTQISGMKKITLFAPDDTPYLYGGKASPENPDYDKHPLLQASTAHVATLKPGDLVFMPSKWWHHTEILENSITYSYNFFNEYNISNYLMNLLTDKSGLSNYVNYLNKI